MHIRKIVIENIRCFDRVELDLTRPDGSLAGWTVLAGRNGSGKSTLLKAIALAVAGPRTADKLQTSFADWIRMGCTHAFAWTDIAYKTRTGEPGIPLDHKINWRAEMREPEPIPDYNPNSIVAGPWGPNTSGWFVAAYGPFRRLGLRDDQEAPGPPMVARLKSLFDEDATLAEAVHWLREVHADWLNFDHQAELLKQQGRHPSKVAEMVDDAQRRKQLFDNVISLLNNNLLPENVSVAGLNERRELVIKKEGVSRSIRSFSDGYRTTIALVCDIVRQMHRCFNEKLELTTRIINGKPIVQVDHEGIVLIDEVDAHLHVSWQQRIGFWLKQHFPNIQFIVTTHSPFVCQAADPKGLIRLPVPGSGEHVEHVSDELYYTVVNGDADDAVMTSLFGLDRPHSEQAETLRSRIAKLEVKDLRGLATPEEQEELARLSAQLPKTGSAVVDQALRKLGEMG